MSNLVGNVKSFNFGLLISWFLAVFHITHHDDTGSDFVGIVTFVSAETENLEGFGSTVEFKSIVHSVDNDHTLAGPVVILGVVTDHAHLENVRGLGVHDLIEDMVVSLSRQLKDY